MARIDLNQFKDFAGRKASQPFPLFNVDSKAHTPKDFQGLLAFDDHGTPVINMTPDLGQDATDFAVFNTRTGRKEFPNQGGSKIKNLVFGSYKGSDTYAYVRREDEWHYYKYDLGKEYPNLGQSADLRQFDSFVELSHQLDKMADNKEAPERLILVVPPTLRDLVWDFLLSKAFEGERSYSGPPIVTGKQIGRASCRERV